MAKVVTNENFSDIISGAAPVIVKIKKRTPLCGRGSMVERDLAKVETA